MRPLRYTAVIIAALFMLSVALPVVHAGIQSIDTTADDTTVDGLCSLREGVTAANAQTATADCPNIGTAPNTLQLANGATYTLTSNMPNILQTLTVEPASGTAIIQPSATFNTVNRRVLRFNSTGTLTLNNMTFRNGGSTTFNSSGGCIQSFGGGVVSLTNMTFDACYTMFGGGAVSASNDSSLAVTNSTFTSNRSGNIVGGGAITISGGSLTISGSTFTGNSLVGDFGEGGAVTCFTCSLSISGSTFSNNNITTTSGGFAGAIYVDTEDNATISGSTFINNSADGGGSTASGGAIALFSQNTGLGTLTVSNSAFVGNTATGGTSRGGVIYVGSGVLSIISSRMESNTAQDGGAIYYDSPQSGTVQSSCIVDNDDEAVLDTAAAGTLDASGGGVPANANWWGTHWGPRITDAGGGSAISSGDSINGNGDTGNPLVDVNLSDPGDINTPPTGHWLTSEPFVAGATCLECDGLVSGAGLPRMCS